jgi:hypothetical protein
VTLKGARADLAAKIVTAVAGIVDVDVLPYDPPTISGTAVTVSTAGVAPTDWRLYVRVYVPAIQSEEGQDRLDDVVEAVETVADSLGSSVPRSDWDFVYDDGKDCFLMVTIVEYPREDWG